MCNQSMRFLIRFDVPIIFKQDVNTTPVHRPVPADVHGAPSADIASTLSTQLVQHVFGHVHTLK